MTVWGGTPPPLPFSGIDIKLVVVERCNKGAICWDKTKEKMKYLPFSVQNLYQEAAEQEHLPDISADSVFWINAFAETDVYQFSPAKKVFAVV